MSETTKNLFDDEISNLKLSFDSNYSFSIEFDEKNYELDDLCKEIKNIHTTSTKDIDLAHIDDEIDTNKLEKCSEELTEIE